MGYWWQKRPGNPNPVNATMEPLRNAATSSSADNKSSNLTSACQQGGNYSNQTSQSHSAPSAQESSGGGGENAPPLASTASSIISTGGRVRKQAVIANVAAEPAKKKAKKFTNKPQAGCIEIKEEVRDRETNVQIRLTFKSDPLSITLIHSLTLRSLSLSRPRPHHLVARHAGNAPAASSTPDAVLAPPA